MRALLLAAYPAVLVAALVRDWLGELLWSLLVLGRV